VNVKKKTRKPGRPKLPRGTAKGKVVQVRFDAEDFLLGKSAARESKQPLSEWIRRVVRNAAEEQMCQQTLHDAIKTVLMERPDLSATTAQISEEIGKRGLYTRKDGRTPKAQQINARARKYPELFDLSSDGVVRLRG
jgi:hypothetical protein